MKSKDQTVPAALLIGAVLIFLTALSLLYILLSKSPKGGLIADIYQSGELIASIPLNEVRETYRFTVTGDEGHVNEIEIRPGSIGIISADCPDKLCVRQGFISDSRLPVTCLPNRVVIRLRPQEENSETISPDIISY